MADFVDNLNDRIDPVPAASLCLDGLQRHIQSYEQTIIVLRQENQELQALLEAAQRQIDILRTQQVPLSTSVAPTSQAMPIVTGSTGVGSSRVTEPQVEQPVVENPKIPPVHLPQISQTATVVTSKRVSRHIPMHCRAVIKLHVQNNFLLTGSCDGTARLWNLQDQTFKTSLYSFRASHSVTSVSYLPLGGLLALATSNKRVYFYQLETALRNAAEYADVSDVLEGALKLSTGEPYLSLQEQASAVAELSKNSLLIFSAGLLTPVTIDDKIIRPQPSQPYSEATASAEPLYFTHAISLGNMVFATVRERLIAKQTGQYLPATESFLGVKQPVDRTAARLLQFGQNLKPTPHVLRDQNITGDLTPVAMFPIDAVRIAVLFNCLEQRIAIFDTQQLQFFFPREPQAGPDAGPIITGCADKGRVFVLQGEQNLTLSVFKIEGTDANLQQIMLIDDLVGPASAIAVQDETVVIGGMDGDVVVLSLK